MVKPKVKVWILRVCLAQLLLITGGVHVVRILAQSQDAINATVAQVQTDLARRVDAIERSDPGGRLKLLESDMSEVKTVGRAVAIAVICQLIVALMGLREKLPRRS